MFGRRLKEAREKAGLTQEQLGEKIGKAGNTVYRWESKSVIPRDIFNLIPLLARTLGVDESYLLNPASPLDDTSMPISPLEKTHEEKTRVKTPVGESPVWIPVVEPHVCAGDGNGYYEIDWAPVGNYPIVPGDLLGIAWHSGTLRIIRVDGSSMEPRYRDGDLIIFSEEGVSSGDVIVALWDGRLLLRGYIDDKKAGVYRLKALNTDYADILIHPEDERFQSLGKVVGKVGRLEPDMGFW